MKTNYKLSIILALLILLAVAFDVSVKNEYFEDGSGIVTIGYCVPFMICEEG